MLNRMALVDSVHTVLPSLHYLSQHGKTCSLRLPAVMSWIAVLGEGKEAVALRLSCSSYGEVWKATDTTSNSIVAIKMLVVNNNMDSLKEEYDNITRFQSPFIVRCYNFFHGDSIAWVCFVLRLIMFS